MDAKDVLFKKVQCDAFLKKVYDGRFIDISDGDAEYTDTNNPKLDISCECDGSLEFLKTYYQIKDRSFNGFVVGVKDIVITGYLVVDTNYDYSDSEYLQLSRVPHQVIRCAIVYYRNNRKSYVPLESIKVGD